jgi:co-chaperonin GroES (HSP10)
MTDAVQNGIKEPLTFKEAKYELAEATGDPEQVLTDENIPTPVGYHLLIAMPEVSETYGESGVIKSAKSVQHETILSMVGVVLDMGESAYSDKDRFPNGPWCEVGDYVMFRTNSGTRFKVGGKEMRLMNDDSIEAVVTDPNAISAVN